MAIKQPTKDDVLKRDGYKCRKCKLNKKLTMHHVLPQRLNGSDEKFSLVALCQECHSAWHSLEYELDIAYNAKMAWDIFWLWLKGCEKKALRKKKLSC